MIKILVCVNIINDIFILGDPPPSTIVKQWKELVNSVFKSEDSAIKKPCIAIHCVAVLGRFDI